MLCRIVQNIGSWKVGCHLGHSGSLCASDHMWVGVTSRRAWQIHGTKCCSLAVAEHRARYTSNSHGSLSIRVEWWWESCAGPPGMESEAKENEGQVKLTFKGSLAHVHRESYSSHAVHDTVIFDHSLARLLPEYWQAHVHPWDSGVARHLPKYWEVHHARCQGRTSIMPECYQHLLRAEKLFSAYQPHTTNRSLHLSYPNSRAGSKLSMNTSAQKMARQCWQGCGFQWQQGTG